MSRVIFVDNLLFVGDVHTPSFDLQPHLGLLSLVAVARNGGHEAEVFDPKLAIVRGELPWDHELYERAAGAILGMDPTVVGFTSLGCNFHCVVQMASAIHARRPTLPIILGGPHASILHEEILTTFECFAAIARHEAEETLLPLLERLASAMLDGVPGVSWRRADGAVVCNPGAPTVDELDELPRPALEVYPFDERRLESIRVEAGRGCPFSCTFCSTASFFGRSYRIKSPARLLEEMHVIETRYGVRRFKLNHDLFTVNRKKVLSFCQAVEPFGYAWSCSARVDCVDDALLTAMARSGCENIYFGIETGNRRVQESSRKRLDLDLVEPTIAMTGALGISTTTSFIIGYPDETSDERDDTLDLAGRLHLAERNKSQIHLLTPEPGTAMLAEYRANLRFDERRTGFNLPRFLSADDILIDAHPELFVTHFYYEGKVAHCRNVFDAEIWRQLSIVSRDGYAYLLQAAKNSLSALLGRWHELWLARHGADADIPADALLWLVAASHGQRSPIVSLLRYQAACRRVRKTSAPPPPTTAEVAAGYRLSPRAALLRDVDEGMLLGRLSSGEETSELRSWIITPSAEPEAVSARQLDEPTADLLEELGKGRYEFLQFVERADIRALQEMRILEELAPSFQ